MGYWVRLPTLRKEEEASPEAETEVLKHSLPEADYPLDEESWTCF